ncbi:MAG: hypothetical protein ACFE9T_00395 [Promethearchaeota archaeon]
MRKALINKYCLLLKAGKPCKERESSKKRISYWKCRKCEWYRRPIETDYFLGKKGDTTGNVIWN